MGKGIELDALSIEQLSGMVSAYPWFVCARKELYSRLIESNLLDERQCAEATMHIGDRKILARLLRNAGTFESGSHEQKEDGASVQMEGRMPSVQHTVVRGGDFFSQEDYDRVKQVEKLSFVPKAPAVERNSGEQAHDLGFYTETLAQIYIDQGFFDQAIVIYSKLILEYPEKSAYFATLIDKLKENIKD